MLSAYILAGVEHGPPTPRLLSRIRQPCRQGRIPYDQWEDGRGKGGCMRDAEQTGCYRRDGDAEGSHGEEKLERLKTRLPFPKTSSEMYPELPALRSDDELPSRRGALEG